jgi:hypothetical protein
VALERAGHKEEISFQKPEVKLRRNRPRKAIWFNPPYSMSVATNLTKMFTKIVDKSFPKNHDYLHKLFNNNNMRLSYSCTPNMSSIVSSHNKTILNPNSTGDDDKKCNCRVKSTCPMNGECLAAEIVYEAEVNSDDDTKLYTGASETSFKLRWGNHKKAFNNTRYRHDTVLSTYIWSLKDRDIDYNIKWRIVKKSRAYTPALGTCRLCLDEKTIIMRNSNNPAYLNKRNEFFSRCRHRRKFLLGTIKPIVS